MLTIVMYHYVRDLERSSHPRLKALRTADFDGQLEYVLRHYAPCSAADVVAASRGLGSLPENACHLSFDDGFLDHFMTVFPRLESRGIPASFYPPARAVLERTILDVHRVQFVLAAVADPSGLAGEVLELVRPWRADVDLPSDAELMETYGRPNRWDPAEVIFVKRALQRGLPEPVRSAVAAELFGRHVTGDEAAFAARLYVDLEQLRTMARHGFEIGGHGYAHRWLEGASSAEQAEEIERTASFLADVRGEPSRDWAMAYPFGSYDGVTLSLLERAGCALGLTTRVGLVEDLAAPLELNRIDTNDLPCSPDAPLSVWTVEAKGAELPTSNSG
ncbi:MAG: polysaccharide deacetylase family protein [Actinomycetota bacterium]|nr:polysaccharide deacetylase family protein [Actinomycetota bacterium]